MERVEDTIKNEPEGSLEEQNRRLREENEILLEAHNELLKQQAEINVDPLTKLPKRPEFEFQVNSYLEMAKEDDSITVEGLENNPKVPVVSVIFFDIDDFGKFNKQYGERVGDAVLRRVAAVINLRTRGYDPVCRWGGEEMALAMIGAEEEDAKNKAGFICNEIRNLKFDDIDPSLENLRVTVSAGVASSRKFSKFEELFDAADSAMRFSKKQGKDQVSTHSKLPRENNE